MSRSGVTFVGHSTVLIALGPTRILTDPWLRSSLLGLRRAVPPSFRAPNLPPIDAVLVSHAHPDHLDPKTLRKLPRVPLCVPAGAERHAGGLGFADLRVLELWGSTRVGAVDITAVPVQHTGGRWRARPGGVCGFVLDDGRRRVLFVGDVDMKPSDHFDRIAERFDLDLALLPIGGMLPPAYYERRRHKPTVHIDPAGALDLFLRSGARRMVPIHWGALSIGIGRRDQVVRRLLEVVRERGLDGRVVVLEQGGTLEL